MSELPTDELSVEDLDWVESDVSAEEVRDLVSAFEKALRAFQLYDKSNPVYDRFVESLREAFTALWERTDRLVITVEESRLLHGEAEVYANDVHAESLAFALFKDGVREITLLSGIQGVELEPLLKVIHKARTSGQDGDDLLAMLWEADFRHFEYRFVDLLAEGVTMPESGEGATQEELDAVREDLLDLTELGLVDADDADGSVEEDGRSHVDPPPLIELDGLDPTLYSLDQREMARLEEEIRLEMERDLREDVLAALFDRLEKPEFPEQQTEILEIFSSFVPGLLSRGALASAAKIVEELRVLEEKPDVLDGPTRLRVSQLLDEFSQPETIAELIQAMEEGTLEPTSEDLGLLLQHLHADALGPLIAAAERVAAVELRAVLREAVKGIAARHRGALIELLHADDAVVAHGAARLVGGLQVTDAAPDLVELMEHPEPGVRLAAIGAAVSLKTSLVANGLIELLTDEERDVRIAAVKGLAQIKYALAAPNIRSVLTGRAIRTADVTEMVAFFEAYGELAGAESVPFLAKILASKGLLRKEPSQIRAAAALALAKIGTPDAQQALMSAREDADPVVRSAVGRSLRSL